MGNDGSRAASSLEGAVDGLLILRIFRLVSTGEDRDGRGSGKATTPLRLSDEAREEGPSGMIGSCMGGGWTFDVRR